jgi:serine/threonine-protein kinase
LFFGGFGLNYLVNNSPVPTTTISPTYTVTSKPPTFTSVPFTHSPTPTKTLSLMPTLAPMISEKDGVTLLAVPAGEFTMGSDIGDGSEKPAHTVYLDAYWIDETEVTNAMYAKCVDDDKCTLPDNTVHFGNLDYAKHPVVFVDWYQANAYCSWAGRRLPTEAEWEKAARGTDARSYPWGEEINCDKANYNSICVDKTSPVKNYPNGVSPYGAYDMAGNVWEWVTSLYKPYPYNTNDGREKSNFSGDRVLRGGAWNNYDFEVHSFNRNWFDPTYSIGVLGFRCARSAD